MQEKAACCEIDRATIQRRIDALLDDAQHRPRRRCNNTALGALDTTRALAKLETLLHNNLGRSHRAATSNALAARWETANVVANERGSLSHRRVRSSGLGAAQRSHCAPVFIRVVSRSLGADTGAGGPCQFPSPPPPSSARFFNSAGKI